MGFARGLACKRWSRIALAVVTCVLALGFMGQGSTALAWGGKGGAQSRNSVSPATCAPDSSTVDTNAYPEAEIYYITSSNGVNVRQGAGTGYCIITTQGYQADVVRVPGVNSVNANGYTWIKVAYFLGQCQYCANYSWSNTGWIATVGLSLPGGTDTCELSAGCDGYSGAPAGQSGWQFAGPFPPTNPEWSKSTCQANQGNTYNSCYWYSYHQNATHPGVYASSVNPNWFGDPSTPNTYSVFYWNWDWWVH